MKKRLFKILFWLCTKLDPHEMKRASIDLELDLDLRKLVPANNQWQHLAITVEWWVKRDKYEDRKFAHVTVNKNSELHTKFFLEGETNDTRHQYRATRSKAGKPDRAHKKNAPVKSKTR